MDPRPPVVKLTQADLERLLDALPVAVNVKDRQGRWLYANPAMLGAFNIPPADYRGRTDSQQVEPGHFYHPALSYCERTDAEAWVRGGVSHAMERIPRPDGGINAFEVTKVALAGEPDLLLVLGHPAQRLVSLEEQQVQMRHDAAIGRMVPGLIHDLNNLLTIIQGHAELAQGQHPAVDSALGRITAAVQMASALAGTAQGMVRGGSGRHSAIDLTVLVQQVARMAWSRTETRQLSITVPPQPVVTACDRALVGRALLNLVLNARQWTGPRGRVAVTLTAEGEGVRLEVDDDGPGIPEDQRARVFEEGVTHRPDGQGLGLVQVADCARLHGGSITATTSPWGGCRMRLDLPRMPAHEAATTDPADGIRGRRIAILDPDPAIAGILQGLLEGCAHATRVEDPRDLPDLVMADRFDLIITDLDLPYCDGLTLHRRLAELGHPLPMVLTTTNAVDLRFADGLPPGVVVLVKPFRRAEVLAALARARLPGAPSLTERS